LGGDAQLAHPPPGTVRAVPVAEKVTVCVPSVSDVTFDKLAPVMGRTVVELVYALVGVEIGVNCANAGALHVSNKQVAILRFTNALPMTKYF
jgi:hypothetical protein